MDLPISDECKRVLAFAAEEADLGSSKPIRTEHLLLGLLREKKSLAAEILQERGVRLESVREALNRTSHEYSPTPTDDETSENLPAEIREALDRLNAIVKRMEQAVANRDFATARACSDEELVARASFRALCEKHGLESWRFR